MGERVTRNSGSVVLDGSGTGSVTFGPSRIETEYTSISVSVSTNVDEPTASIYRGTVNPGTLKSSTFSGSKDTDSSFNDGSLFPGEYYTCQWTGGDPGAVATISYTYIEKGVGVNGVQE